MPSDNNFFRKPELLAPAGSREALEAVIEAGADAVYLSGKRFAMRQHAAWLNFDENGLCEASDILHGLGRKLYVTLNNLYTDEEMRLLPDYVAFLAESVRPDAFIVTDFGLLRLLAELGIQIPLFASVMMQIHTVEAVRELRELGFSRFVAPQHLPLESVRRIREETGMEVEHFIHGDTCSAVQGFCMHSGIATGELAGRGRCLKSCRWAWDFVLLGAEGEKVLEEGVHALARKDLCLYKQLPQLIHAGVTSFKIEGRARPGAFLRPIVAAYRALIDEYCADPAAYIYESRTMRDLEASRQRDFTTSWTFGNPARDAVGYGGEREPRFFSLAIEEAGIELTEAEEFARQAGSIEAFPDASTLAPPALTVRCGSPAAAAAALDAGADRILVGGEVAPGRGQRWTLDALLETAALARSRGKLAMLATPRLTAERQVDEQRWLLSRLEGGSFDAVHAHNLGLLRLARETSDTPVHADFSFNLFNALSVETLADLGVRQATLSLEATLPQAVAIRARTRLPLELIVHGSLPGMILEQCLIAALTLDGSANDPCLGPCQTQRFALRDQLGQLHPIEPDQHCRNHLMMGKDLCALLHLEPFLRAGFASLRLELPFAEPELAALATSLYRQAIDRFAAGARGQLVDAQDVDRLRRCSPRPFSLGGFANAYRPVALPDGELPTNLVIKYDCERRA